MINKNVANIAKFDFLNTLKSKGFIVLNIALCLLVVIAINLSSIISLFKTSGIIHSNDYVLEVWEDSDSIFFEALQSVNKDIIKEVRKSDTKIQYDYDSLDKKTVGINITSNADGMIENVEIISKDTISEDVTENITDILTEVRNKIIEKKYNISEQDAEIYKENIKFNAVILSNAKNQNELTTTISTFVGYIIFMLVMTITTTVASNVANEKTSKSAEYILSTIPAKDYLNGKVLAANLKTVLTIVLVVFYLLMGLLLNSVIMTQAKSTVEVNEVQDVQIVETVQNEQNAETTNAVSFNALAYVVITIAIVFLTNTLISYIQVAFASKIKNISELDNAIMLPTIVLAVAYFISNMLPNTNNVLTYILSCIPILSMYILPTVYMLNKVNLIVILLSFTVLIITLIVTYKVVSGKFKNNILDLGKKKVEKEDEDEKLETRKFEENKIFRARLKKFMTCVAFALILSISLGNIVGIIPYFVQNENLKLLLNCISFVIYIGIPAWVLNKLLTSSTRAKKEKKEPVTQRKQKVVLYMIGLVGLALAQIVNTMFVYIFNIGQSESMEIALSLPQSKIGVLLYILYLAIIPAIFEELLFRKAILNGAKRFGSRFAIIFTAVAFGLFHQNLQQILGTTLIGFVLALVTIKTGDIKTAIALHFTNNFFATLVQIAYSSVESGEMTIVTLICMSLVLVIAILAFIGVILLIKSLVTKKHIFKISENENVKKVKITSIFANYYVIILFAIIVMTTVLNSKIN